MLALLNFVCRITGVMKKIENATASKHAVCGRPDEKPTVH